ncbi:LirA/MavJ family T4SS effector [Roseomonas sp. F4]
MLGVERFHGKRRRLPRRGRGMCGMGWPWNGNTDDPIHKFPCLAPIQDDMKEIYRLFNNQADVAFCLQKLSVMLDLSSVSSFQSSLLELEMHYGFDYNVITTVKQLSSVEFLGYIGARRPIDDLAFKDSIHGRSTHRIQFMMIAMWKQHQKGQLKSGAFQIYKAMATAVATGAKPDASGNYPFEQVAWNHYFDVDPALFTVNNACRPDYLCGTFMQDKFPKLASVAE